MMRLLVEDERLIKEWDWEKNISISPDILTCGSGIKVYWKCYKGHSWKTDPRNRIHGTNCPYCANKKVLQGYNDLKTLNPNLAKQWDFEKNADLKPTQVTSGSRKKVWWKCDKGHSWQAYIYSRNKGRGCKTCLTELHTSFQEQAIYYYVKKIFPDALNRYKDIKNNISEFDIYIPSKRIAIEYDGIRFHEHNSKDKLKSEVAIINNIDLIRVKEVKNITEKENDVIYYLYNLDNVKLDDIIIQVIKKLSMKTKKYFNINIDIEKDRNDIMNQYIIRKKNNSLETVFPNIAKDWNYNKNGNLTPDLFDYSSRKIVWWKCEKGHEWQQRITSRRGKCPFCSNRKISKGFNDLRTTYPYLLEEWDYEKNDNLLLDKLGAGSRCKVWWKCQKGHSWLTTIVSRTYKNTKCPICTNRKVLEGFNDLATTHSYLLKEWDYEKNKLINPKNILAGSEKKVWWKCEYGHSWLTRIDLRKRGSRCPICSKGLRGKFL